MALPGHDISESLHGLARLRCCFEIEIKVKLKLHENRNNIKMKI